MAAPDGGRRIVSVLFADVAGSTAIGESLGPERSKLVFDEVVRLMSEHVRRFGGTVAQLAGDGLYALFGAPVANEDDAERAVRAALAIHAALAVYAHDVGEAYGIELAARVAINTGPIVLPESGGPDVERYNALGDTATIAARLQEAAGPFGVVVGPETARQIGARFELETLGPLRLKGKAEPVEAFRLAGERAEQRLAERPLIGRAEELAALDGALALLVEGGGAIVSLAGEPGIGKSRLVAEARARHEPAVRFLYGTALSYATGVAYVPVREVLRGWLGLGLGDPEARLRIELKAELGRLLGGAGTDGAYPFLANLLGLALEPEVEQLVRGFASDSVQRQTHEAVADVVRALAGERPLCLVLDDLQWADGPTLALVEDLLPCVEEQALCLLLVHRSEPEQPSWDVVERARRRYRHRFRELELAPLPAGECAALAEAAAGAAVPEDIAALLAERSGGNPFFLEEALRELVERGALRQVNGRYERAGELTDAAVPAVIQEALQARLDRLAPEAREVVGLAAVAGRRFTLPLLARLEPREHVLPALTELQRLDLIVEERRRPAPEYRFKHGLVQEAAYASLTSAGRRALHRRVAEALEELAQEDPRQAYAQLGRHYAEADEPAKAAKYLLQAGDAARALDAHEEAVAHYRRAVGFLDRLGGAGAAREALFKVAHLHHLRFEYEAADAAWAEAFAHPEPPPVRHEPVERVEVPTSRHGVPVPGLSYNVHTGWVTRHLFRGLFRLARGVDPVPDLAQAVSVSPDGREYRFRLRPDALWSDGTLVTADDFAYALGRIGAEGGPAAHLLEAVAAAEALDEATLALRLRGPRPYFLDILADVFACPPWPRHQAEPLGERWPDLDRLVGNGPFVLAERGEEGLLLRASPLWAGGRGNVAEVELVYTLGLEEWRQGRFDLGGNPSGEVLDSPDTVAVARPTLGWWAIAFRTDRPPLDDLRVRRALAYACDRERVAAALKWPPAAGGLIPPSVPGHGHDLALPHDPERARALLAEAGFPGGAGLPELHLNSFGALHPRRDELVAAYEGLWAAIGVRVRVTLHALGSPLDWESDCWVLGFLGDFADPDAFLGTLLDKYPFVHRDAEIEELLARARETADRTERLDLYRACDRLLVAERAAVVPLAYSEWQFLRRPWIEGWWLGPLALATLDEVVVRRERR